jgi:hypothetical protein
MTHTEIQQAVDACRPGSEDLQGPEMAALSEAVQSDPEVRRCYERSQQFDAAVSWAFRDVPVPVGLADRLLAAVGPSSEQSTAKPSELVSLPSTDRDIQIAANQGSRWPQRRNRRIWTVAAGTLTAAAALAVFLLVVPYFGAEEPQAGDRLAGDIVAWTDLVVRQGWNEDLQAAQVHERPLDRTVRASPQRWCSIATAYDSQTIVYDIAPPGGALALVFCMRSKSRTSSLPDIPPWNAFSATGGLTLGVWRRGDMVYVLVVGGGARRYRELIEASQPIGFLLDGHPLSLTAIA